MGAPGPLVVLGGRSRTSKPMKWKIYHADKLSEHGAETLLQHARGGGVTSWVLPTINGKQCSRETAFLWLLGTEAVGTNGSFSCPPRPRRCRPCSSS